MNKKTRKGFTLIELLIVVVIVGILALAAIPLITGHARDARRAEAEAVAGTLKTSLRASFAKTGTNPASFTAADMDEPQSAGAHHNAPTYNGTSTTGTVTIGMISSSDGSLTYAFGWTNGQGNFAWTG